MRLQYPPEVEIILMPCSGRVDIIHLLKAFEAAADAVFVAGCREVVAPVTGPPRCAGSEGGP